MVGFRRAERNSEVTNDLLRQGTAGAPGEDPHLRIPGLHQRTLPFLVTCCLGASIPSPPGAPIPPAASRRRPEDHRYDSAAVPGWYVILVAQRTAQAVSVSDACGNVTIKNPLYSAGGLGVSLACVLKTEPTWPPRRRRPPSSWPTSPQGSHCPRKGS